MAENRPKNTIQETPPPTLSKKGKLNTMELLGIGLFFLALCLYGLSQCGGEAQPNTATVIENTIDSVEVDSMEITNENSDRDNNSSFSNNTPPPVAPSPRIATSEQKLYIIIDSLKLRKGPNLDSSLITYLKYGEEVINLGERTVLEKIRISTTEVRTAPWFKIKTSKGKIGWAFGAGLQFYPLPKKTNLQVGSN